LLFCCLRFLLSIVVVRQRILYPVALSSPMISLYKYSLHTGPCIIPCVRFYTPPSHSWPFTVKLCMLPQHIHTCINYTFASNITECFAHLLSSRSRTSVNSETLDAGFEPVWSPVHDPWCIDVWLEHWNIELVTIPPVSWPRHRRGGYESNWNRRGYRRSCVVKQWIDQLVGNVKSGCGGVDASLSIQTFFADARYICSADDVDCKC